MRREFEISESSNGFGNRINRRLLFVGNMLGRNPGHITSQGQIVADLFVSEGFEATIVSSKINRAARLFDVVRTIIKNRRKTDLIVLEIYSGWYMFLAAITSELAARLKIPVIAVLHGGNLPDFARRHPRWTRRVLSLADLLVAPSNYLADAMRANGFAVRVVPNVIEIEKYPFRLRSRITPRLIWMRSFHPAYNPLMGIKVLEKLKRKYPQATLVMAGRDKGLEEKTKEAARQLGVADAVRFPGFLDEIQKRSEFSAADIYINTNRIDNMPVAAVEACAFGLPIVATDVGGISNLLQHRETGILVADADVEAMVEAVETLLENPDLSERLSRSGRRLAEKSGWHSVKKLWTDLFDEVLNRKNAN